MDRVQVMVPIAFYACLLEELLKHLLSELGKPHVDFTEGHKLVFLKEPVHVALSLLLHIVVVGTTVWTQDFKQRLLLSHRVQGR